MLCVDANVSNILLLCKKKRDYFDFSIIRPVSREIVITSHISVRGVSYLKVKSRESRVKSRESRVKRQEARVKRREARVERQGFLNGYGLLVIDDWR